MGLISTIVVIKWNSNNKKWYESKGYIYTKMKDEFDVCVEDLPSGSGARVDVECDNVHCQELLKNIRWVDYSQCLQADGKYYCQRCATGSYAHLSKMKTILKKGTSFKQWCIFNNRLDVLNRFNTSLNILSPDEFLHSTKNKYYFDCPRGIHSPELRDISNFTGGQEGSMRCNQCNSFAQWGIDNICEDFLEKYWDYEKNNKLGIDPWKLSYGSKIKVFVRCQNNVVHKSYDLNCSLFVHNGNRCPKCSYSKGEAKLSEYLIKYQIKYEPQKTFSDLLGLGGRLLSYDFYLTDYNLLIEYQGNFHDGTVEMQTDKQFKYQQDHDKRKSEYAKINNIKFLEIWYWNFENIEEILLKELNYLNTASSF